MLVIPGFVDNDYNEADQVVENLQRNALTAREIADYIGRELAKGYKKIEIAKAISKSPAFVSQHVTLLDLPDVIAQVFNSGRAKDVTIINELVTAFKRQEHGVTNWLKNENQIITRDSVKLLREFLDVKHAPLLLDEKVDVVIDVKNGKREQVNQQITVENVKSFVISTMKKAVIQVQHNEKTANLLLDRRPLRPGFAWIKYDDNSGEIDVNLAEVRIVAVFEG